jgi:DNA-binding NarL/FixJ family response regulator
MRTVVADADPLARLLIRNVLRDAGIVVVAEARTAAEAVELVLRHAPDVVHVDGEAAVSRRMARRLIEHFRERPALRPIKGPLTAREWEVVGLLDPERTTDDIADTLVISSETVRSHVKSIMRKLDVHSRHEAPAAAERLRLTTA